MTPLPSPRSGEHDRLKSLEDDLSRLVGACCTGDLDLIKRAAGEVFEGYFVGFDFANTVRWFDSGNNLKLSDTAPADECIQLLEAVPDLIDNAQVPFDFKRSDDSMLVSACEFVLEGLYAQNKISRNEEGGYTAATKARKDRRGMIYDDLTESGRYS